MKARQLYGSYAHSRISVGGSMMEAVRRPTVLALLCVASACSCLSIYAGSYTVVDTGQSKCYDNRNEIATPTRGQPFYGQDAQYPRYKARYESSVDGLTVHDQNTDLIWQSSPDTNGDKQLDRSDKLTLKQAQLQPAKLNAAKFGGFTDWRLPTIKELYSLFNANGRDPSGPSSNDTSKLMPFIDTKYFKFAYGDTKAGERVIDSQYISSTRYVGKSAHGSEKLFGVNFADGRIKGYDLQMPGGVEKTFFVICVRGNSDYGKNDYRANGDGTITDRATGLMWSRTDSGKGMNWQDSLAWVQKMNAEKYLGHDDWRMPNVKELQSIVDYARSPDTSQSAAIDPIFECTRITNEGGKNDYPCYWSNTTHAGMMGGGAAMYVAFGRAAGWVSTRGPVGGLPDRRRLPGATGRQPGRPPMGMFPDSRMDSPPPGEGLHDHPNATASDYLYMDVHGAGSQRSDPKSGDASQYPFGRGPQGDVVRISNFVRLVRDNRPHN